MSNKRINIKALLPYLLLPLGILLTYASSSHPELIERIYSNAFSKLTVQALSCITGIFNFSLAEFVLFIFISILLYVIIKNILLIIKAETGKAAAAAALLRNLFALAGVIYISFIILWGFNYHRLPFSTIAGLEVQPASVDELVKVCESILNRTNELRTRVGEDPSGVMQLRYGKQEVFNQAYKGYGEAAQIYPELGGRYGKPKGVILSPLMSYAGISGIYFPFTAEANVNTTIPSCIFPSTTCHEMAHQRGFAREDEANYIAYLTSTIHPDADFQYSGYLLALINCMNALYDYDTGRFKEIRKGYSEGVSKDLSHLFEFWQSYEGPVEKLSSNINDAYLKANMQKDGIHSYGRMVDLLIAEYRGH